MKSIFSFVKNQLLNLSLMTEFLEACDWDEAVRDEKLQIVINYLQCEPLPIPGLDFDEWLQNVVKHNLVGCGLSNLQAKIVCKIIINSKEEILLQLNLPEQ